MPTPTPSIETLPLLVLENICEYLDDTLDKKRSLQAFSSTCRSLHAASAASRFCRIHLKIGPPEEIEGRVKRWTDILDIDGRHRHVRQLKISYATATEKRQGEGISCQDDEQDPYEEHVSWKIRSQSSSASFVMPSKSPHYGHETGRFIHNFRDWTPLCDFIHKLPGLQDLVWAYSRIAPTVLDAVHTRDCRLHIHNFHLSSLVQFRDRPQPISLEDLRLATSPSLTSILVSLCNYTTDGELDYTAEAVEEMVSGMAPNLSQVFLQPYGPGDSLDFRAAMRLGKPAWTGFLLPRTGEENRIPVRGDLRSLHFNFAHHDMQHWSSLTDFTMLRHLSLRSDNFSADSLAEIAVRGKLTALRTLDLAEMEDETDTAQESLHQLLSNLSSLQSLTMHGYISNETFDVILHHQGNLRNLSLYPYHLFDESKNRVVAFSEINLQRLAEHCSKLEQISIPINRTRGDDRETGSYRALSKLRQLKYANLTLEYFLGPDEDSWDEERDGEHPVIAAGMDEHEIPTVYLAETFTNSAIDASLAMGIFKLIATNGKLRYLRVHTTRNLEKRLWCSRGVSGPFQRLMRWLNRSWDCTKDATGGIRVVEIDKEDLASAGEEWRDISENPQWYNEIFGEVFKEVWPPKTAEWWKDWTSLPLSGEPT